ncbi:MAG: hypothetical protein ACI8WB_002140 [Phenylobacterium sp.]
MKKIDAPVVRTKNYRQGAVLALVISGLLSSHSYANSFTVSYGQLEQQISVEDETVAFKPMGPSMSLSMDLTDNWQFDLDYQHFEDDLNHLTEDLDTRHVDVDLTAWGGSVNYFIDNWSFSGSYSMSEEDTFIVDPERSTNFRAEDVHATTLGASAAYGWASGNWFYNVSAGVQYSDWALDNEILNIPQPPPPPGGNGPPPPLPPPPIISKERTRDNSTSLSSSVSLAHFWSLSDDTGVLVGGLLSWHHVLSGESSQVTRNGTNQPTPTPNAPNTPNGGNGNQQGNNGLTSLSGDDSYGQVSLYVSYDLSEAWSIDLDVAADLSSQYSATSWSMSVGYYF